MKQPITNLKNLRRDKRWSVPIEVPGLSNFHRVTDHLYRGAQPTKQGVRQLSGFGIRTLISLRAFHSDRLKIGETGLVYEQIYMKTWRPQMQEIVRFLQIATKDNLQPVFVHCLHGADRTGMMCGIYRVLICNWSLEDALLEMTQGGFGFHRIWKNLLRYMQRLDFEEIKSRTGIQSNHLSPNFCSSGSML